MKKIFGIFIALAFVSTICFAQEAAKNTPAPAKPSYVATETKIIVCKVVSVTVADPAKGVTNGSISVVDEAGKIINYTVSGAVKVFDNAFNAISLSQLKAGDKVKVAVKKTATREEAKTITVLK